MSKHLFGIVCTHHGTAANNRAETEGNVTTLQKMLWADNVHSTVSAEAIRFALRKYWQGRGLPLNREWQDALNMHKWNDPAFARWEPDARKSGVETFIDDDVLGFMQAEAAKEEANAAEVKAAGGRAPRAKGTIKVRRARLEVTRAVSLTPWAGDITFNAASINATPSAAMKGANPVPYGTEVHATRYQYGFALTPESLVEPSRALDVVDAIVGLAEVAGNQARFLFDFSPESIVLRWTDDFAPRMLYGFEMLPESTVGLPEVERRARAGDLDASELIVGGAVAATPEGRRLAELGALVVPGVKAAGDEAKRRLAAHLNDAAARG